MRDRSNYRIPLRIGWSRIRNEIKQRGIYRSRRGINTILMRIRQLGGSILSRLLNLDLKNIRCRQKRGGTLNIARIGPMILTDRNTIPFEFFLRFSKLCHEERRGRWVYFSGMKKERLQDSMVSIISWIVEITGRGVGEGRLLFSFFNSTGKLVPRSPPVLCCRLSLLVAKPRPRI